MKLFFYIVALFAIGSFSGPAAVWAAQKGFPQSVVVFVFGVTWACLAWHCARRLTAGKNW